MRLQDRVAIITGGGRGIGEAVALAMAREGARVVVASRTCAELERVAAQIRALGSQVEVVAADVSLQSDVDRLVEKTLDIFGQIDILVNAAGVQGPIGPMWEADIEEWNRALQINLGGTFMCCRAVLPHLAGRRQGKIINFSGGGATNSRPYFSAYAASKAAVVRLTETLAEEVKEYNIQVNAIAPGAVNTRMLDEILQAGEVAGEKHLAEAKRQLESGGTPPELSAALAVFLASDDSGDLTGKLIAAPHDDWQAWDEVRIEELMSAPWLTLRRIDPHTLGPFLQTLQEK